jgi:hypothetical protein
MLTDLTIYYSIYYQYDATCLQTCPVNVHYLLHIVDSIEAIGPVWCYWAYPMERFCSFIRASVKSRRFLYTNIARRIRDTAQLRVIRELYNLHDVVSFGKTCASTEEELGTEMEGADKLPKCECSTFRISASTYVIHQTPPFYSSAPVLIDWLSRLSSAERLLNISVWLLVFLLQPLGSLYPKACDSGAECTWLVGVI